MDANGLHMLPESPASTPTSATLSTLEIPNRKHKKINTSHQSPGVSILEPLVRLLTHHKVFVQRSFPCAVSQTFVRFLGHDETSLETLTHNLQYRWQATALHCLRMPAAQGRGPLHDTVGLVEHTKMTEPPAVARSLHDKRNLPIDTH